MPFLDRRDEGDAGNGEGLDPVGSRTADLAGNPSVGHCSRSHATRQRAAPQRSVRSGDRRHGPHIRTDAAASGGSRFDQKIKKTLSVSAGPGPVFACRVTLETQAVERFRADAFRLGRGSVAMKSFLNLRPAWWSVTALALAITTAGASPVMACGMGRRGGGFGGGCYGGGWGGGAVTVAARRWLLRWRLGRRWLLRWRRWLGRWRRWLGRRRLRRWRLPQRLRARREQRVERQRHVRPQHGQWVVRTFLRSGLRSRWRQLLCRVSPTPGYSRRLFPPGDDLPSEPTNPLRPTKPTRQYNPGRPPTRPNPTHIPRTSNPRDSSINPREIAAATPFTATWPPAGTFTFPT